MKNILKKSLFAAALLVVTFANGYAADVVWDFSEAGAQSLANNNTYSFLASDGTTEMRYTAGSSDAIVAPSGSKAGYLKENGKTGGGSAKDTDGTTAINKNRLIRLFVTGTGTLTISCTDNIGEYNIYDGQGGTTLAEAYTANTTSSTLTVNNLLWIETSVKGYINKITWTPSSEGGSEGGGSEGGGSSGGGETPGGGDTPGGGAIPTPSGSGSEEIIKVVLSGERAATQTVTGTIGGTSAVKNMGSSSPYKLNSDGAYVSLVLASGSFEATDTLLIDGSKKMQVYYGTAGEGTELLTTEAPNNGVIATPLTGLPTGQNSIYVYRTSSTYNGTLTYMAVHRPSNGGGDTPSTVAVTGVTLNKTATSIEQGQTETLTATVQPSNATNQNISWSSSDESVATVADGVVTTLKAGTATITVTTEDGNKTATCNVTVTAPAAPIEVENISIKSATEIAIGETETLIVTYDPADANTGKAITWTSDKESVAKVDANGKVTGIAVGTAVITATTENNKTATCTVAVKAVSVTSVTVTPTTASLKINGTTTLSYTILPNNATDKTVSWSSDNPNVATVDANGKVTAVAEGTATITVKTKDGDKTATCTVTVTAGPPVPATTLSLHVPEIYEAKEIAGGYNAPLTVVGGREYEVFYINRDNSSNLTIATTSADKAGNICDGSSTSNTAKTKDGWLTIKCNGTGGDTNAGAKDEFQGSIRSAKFNSSSHVMEMHIQGYDQFSFYGNDNNQDASKNKMFEIYIDDVKQTRSPKAYSINRFDISTGEHVIRLTAIGGSDSKLCSFSLRVSQEPRVKYLKGNDSTQSILQTAAIQPVTYTAKYNNIPGAETQLEWIGATATGINLTQKAGDLSDTLVLSGNANCATGEYHYAVVARYNGVETNRVTGKFTIKSDIKCLSTSTNAEVYQGEEMDQIKFKYYALSADDVILTWTGATPAGITGSGNNGTYLIGGTPTQTGDYAYSITVTGADTTFYGKITVKPLDYGTNPVLYLYKNDLAYEKDGVHNYLKSKGWNTIERKAKEDGLRPADQYTNYKFVVISEDVDANNKEVLKIITENGANLPVLNMKGFTYSPGRVSPEGWGEPDNGAVDTLKTKNLGCNIILQRAEHEIFQQLTYPINGKTVKILDNYTKRGVMPIAVNKQGALCLATAATRGVDYYSEGPLQTAIHEIPASERNGHKYICLPLSANATLSTQGQKLIDGIVEYLLSSTPTAVALPVLRIDRFAIESFEGKIDQTNNTIEFVLEEKDYTALDSLTSVAPEITIADDSLTHVLPATDTLSMAHCTFIPMVFTVTDYINVRAYSVSVRVIRAESIEEVEAYTVGEWVNIYDIYGRKVATTNEDIYTMALPKGLYIIQTSQGNTLKIMK